VVRFRRRNREVALIAGEVPGLAAQQVALAEKAAWVAALRLWRCRAVFWTMLHSTIVGGDPTDARKPQCRMIKRRRAGSIRR